MAQARDVASEPAYPAQDAPAVKHVAKPAPKAAPAPKSEAKAEPPKPEKPLKTDMPKFETAADGKPALKKEAKVEFIDDGPGKPAGINRFIGRRPIFAFGNSDGDLQMLQWTAAGPGARFVGIVHHTDPVREYAYDRLSNIGKLDKALDEANQRGWIVVDMQHDWRSVFAFEGAPKETMGLGRSNQ